MKNILLTAILAIAFSSVGINAQQIFIPTPPVINIPVLNPAAMQIRNQVFRNMINGAGKGGTRNAANGKAASGAVDYTLYNPHQENYLPKLLAREGKGNAAEQRATEQFFNSQIEIYEQTAAYHKYPANDVAFALIYFINNNYEIYYDLVDVPIEKDPWAKRAKSGLERLALMNTKRSRKVTPAEDRAMYFQFKEALSAKPEFRKMTDEQKQQVTETLAIMYGIVYASYMKAIDEEDEQLLREARSAAKSGLEELLGVSIEKIKINLSGMSLQ